MSNLVVNIILGILDVVTIYYIYCGLTDITPKFSKKNIILGFMVGFILGISQEYLGSESKLIFYACFIIYIHLHYKKKIYDAVMVFVVLYAFIAVIQITVMLIMLPFSIENETILYLAAQVLSLLITKYICKKLPINKLLYTIEKELILTLFFFVLCCIVYGIFFYINFDLTKPYFLVYLLIFFISMFGIYKTVAKIYYYTNKLPLIRHEMENALAGIHISSYDTDDIACVRETIQEYFRVLGLRINTPCWNNEEKRGMFLEFIQYKNRAKSGLKKLVFDTDIHYEEPHYKVSEPASIIMLGILLDNAIEVSRSGKKIKVSMRIMEEKFMLQVANEFERGIDQEFIKMFQKGNSTKQTDSETHGYGLAKLSELVSGYSGQIFVKEEYSKEDRTNYVFIIIEI